MDSSPARSSTPPRVLFVCVENSCRSQLAEALARLRGLEAFSAGSRPSGRVHPLAIRSMAELGYDLSTHLSKGLDSLPGGPFDAAITMGCGDECPAVGAPLHEDWGIPDPKHLPLPGFAATRELIALRVDELANRLGLPASGPAELLPARVRAWARCRPQAPALQLGERGLTYAELVAALDRAAAWLAARGVSRGDRFVLRLDKGLAAILLSWAALDRGLVVVPVHPGASAEELAAVRADAEPRLLVVGTDSRALAREACGGADGWADVAIDEDFVSEMAAPPDALPAPDDVACLLYTSGTTGRPKGVVLRHAALAANAQALASAWRWSSGDVLLHALPLFHVHGLFVALGGALRAGACTRVLERFDPDVVWPALGAGVTLFMGVPTMYHRLVARHPRPLPELPTVRLFLSGSAPLPAATADAFAALTGRTLVERYGMTEVGMVASQPSDGSGPRGSVGRALPGVELTVVDRHSGAAAGPGECGEVLIGGPSVFDGYWRQPDATAAALTPDGRMRSGDLGHLDDAGNLFLDGRAKELIISGGFNVHPREVEAALEEHPAVSEAAVVGLPDDDLGELVAAAVVLVAGAHASVDELLAHGRARLAPSKAPRRVVLLDELPRNALGKLQRRALAALPAFASR